MSDPTADYNRRATVAGQLDSARVDLSTVNQHQRNGTDFQHSVGYKTEMSSYSWEPSTPFQPSFALTRRLLSSVSQFNFIRDSMEESKPGEVQSQNYGNDLFPVETGTPVTSIMEMQNTIASPKEEKILGSTHLRDLTKRSASNTEHDCATQRDIQNTESVDMAGREADVKIGEIKARDPEYLKMYRNRFKEYVKELIKPTWREGKLSRKAHIMIVKRTVDKIMDTVKPLPASELVDPFDDSVKQHIANFVEYYIDKYGKL